MIEIALVLVLIWVGLKIGALREAIEEMVVELTTARWEAGVREDLRRAPDEPAQRQ